MLWQHGRLALDADLTDAAQLIETLQTFCAYRPQEYAAWEEAVAQFKERVADIGNGLAELIQQERKSNRSFSAAFAEFDRSLADEGVHIIDPFVGTGNFIVRMMREIPRTALERKYKGELHCNEVMLLPYYIASMNIEHEYYDATEMYEPFEGICLVDTFDLAEDRQLPLFAPENTQRVENQKGGINGLANRLSNLG